MGNATLSVTFSQVASWTSTTDPGPVYKITLTNSSSKDVILNSITICAGRGDLGSYSQIMSSGGWLSKSQVSGDTYIYAYNETKGKQCSSNVKVTKTVSCVSQGGSGSTGYFKDISQDSSYDTTLSCSGLGEAVRLIKSKSSIVVTVKKTIKSGESGIVSTRYNRQVDGKNPRFSYDANYKVQGVTPSPTISVSSPILINTKIARSDITIKVNKTGDALSTLQYRTYHKDSGTWGSYQDFPSSGITPTKNSDYCKVGFRVRATRPNYSVSDFSVTSTSIKLRPPTLSGVTNGSYQLVNKTFNLVANNHSDNPSGGGYGHSLRRRSSTGQWDDWTSTSSLPSTISDSYSALQVRTRSEYGYYVSSNYSSTLTLYSQLNPTSKPTISPSSPVVGDLITATCSQSNNPSGTKISYVWTRTCGGSSSVVGSGSSYRTTVNDSNCQISVSTKCTYNSYYKDSTEVVSSSVTVTAPAPSSPEILYPYNPSSCISINNNPRIIFKCYNPDNIRGQTYINLVRVSFGGTDYHCNIDSSYNIMSGSHPSFISVQKDESTQGCIVVWRSPSFPSSSVDIRCGNIYSTTNLSSPSSFSMTYDNPQGYLASRSSRITADQVAKVGNWIKSYIEAYRYFLSYTPGSYEYVVGQRQPYQESDFKNKTIYSNKVDNEGILFPTWFGVIDTIYSRIEVQGSVSDELIDSHMFSKLNRGYLINSGEITPKYEGNILNNIIDALRYMI